jgi:hypothetical protein
MSQVELLFNMKARLRTWYASIKNMRCPIVGFPVAASCSIAAGSEMTSRCLFRRTKYVSGMLKRERERGRFAIQVAGSNEQDGV